ncbi:hypothetical protein T484DRAFT_1864182 [Baffinella frigidus]|nr:hypothetical protein T484DRAFT_1864182 [Cryptophyta sp. CCMP2293]
MDDTTDDPIDVPTLPTNMVEGENGAMAFEKTDSAALDFFANCVPFIEPEHLRKLLEAAWVESPLTALQLIFQTGNVRNAGKMDRDNFYHCLMWLWEFNPDTLLLNIRAIPVHTCLKDILEILVFALHGASEDLFSLDNTLNGKKNAIARKNAQIVGKSKLEKRKHRTERHIRRIALKNAFAATIELPLSEILLPDNVTTTEDTDMVEVSDDGIEDGDVAQPSFYKVQWVSLEIKDKCDAFVLARQEEFVLQTKNEKKQLLLAMKTNGNPSPGHAQQLFDAVVAIFAEGLTDELETLHTNPAGLSGLYAKWAPSIGGRHDKALPLLVSAIAKKVLVGELYQDEWDTLSDEDATHSRRIAYSSKVLSTLRCAAAVPEHFVGKKEFDRVDYDRMPSKCRDLWGERVFLKHDRVRYIHYLKEAEAIVVANRAGGNLKGPSVKTGALLPHEITEQGLKTFQHLRRLEAAVKDGMEVSSDDLENAQAMNTQVNLQWESMVDTIKAAMAKGEGVGRCIPVVDVSGSMSGVPMQEFDEMEGNTPWVTTHGAAVAMFSDAGIPMPKIVYWNLRASVSSPIESKKTQGVVLLSGFSAGLLESFLSNSLDTFTPGSQLENVLADPVYQTLTVADEDE